MENPAKREEISPDRDILLCWSHTRIAVIFILCFQDNTEFIPFFLFIGLFQHDITILWSGDLIQLDEKVVSGLRMRILKN